jgi:uncharacterized protein (TIGR00251 family)
VIPVQQQGESVTYSVKAHPRARRERIAGVLGVALKLEPAAPPVEGKANEACIRFFADLLKVPRSSVTIAAGNSSRNKVIRVIGISAARVEQALAAALSERCSA